MRAFILSTTAAIGAASLHPAAGPASLYWASSPVGPNETCVVAGAHLPSLPMIRFKSGHSEARLLTPVQATAGVLKFVVPPDAPMGSYEVAVCESSASDR